MHPEDVGEVAEAWRDHIAEAWPMEVTCRMQHEAWGYRWVECRSVVELDPEGFRRAQSASFAT